MSYKVIHIRNEIKKMKTNSFKTRKKRNKTLINFLVTIFFNLTILLDVRIMSISSFFTVFVKYYIYEF